jgi:hypothetical protein
MTRRVPPTLAKETLPASTLKAPELATTGREYHASTQTRKGAAHQRRFVCWRTPQLQGCPVQSARSALTIHETSSQCFVVSGTTADQWADRVGLTTSSSISTRCPDRFLSLGELRLRKLQRPGRDGVGSHTPSIVWASRNLKEASASVLNWHPTPTFCCALPFEVVMISASSLGTWWTRGSGLWAQSALP